MCLAIVAGKNTNKNSDFLFKSIVTGSVTNKDGMGFAFKRNSTKKVYISKGYKEVSALIDVIKSKKLGDQDELIVHARIGNKGAVNSNMCHPFVASEDPDEILLNDKYVDKPVFVHNGTFSKIGHYSNVYSDTYFFAKDILGKKSLINLLTEDVDTFEDILSDKLNNSRVAILLPNTDSELITLGNFIEEEGYLFSNVGYKDVSHVNVGGQTKINLDSYRHGYGYGSEAYNNYEEFEDNLAEKASSTTPSNQFVDHSDVMLELFPAFRVPDDIVTENFVDCINKYQFRKYLGLYICVNKTLQSLRVVPTPLNSHHLVYQARDQIKLEGNTIEILTKYKMAEFDCDYQFYKQSTHILYRTYLSNPIPIKYDQLESKFDIRPLTKYKEFYEQYLKLVTNVYPGKNTLKKLSKLLAASNNAEKFTFAKINTDGSKADTKENKKKDRLYFNRDVLELYHFNLIDHIFGNSPEKESYTEYLKYSF